MLTDSLIETTLRSLSQSRVCHVARAYEFPVHVSQGERGTADGSDGRPRRRSRMGCLLSRPYELSPRLLRDLEAASEGTSHAQHHLVPPRPVRHELGWSDLSSVQLLSASGGSCDVFAAVLDGESVAVKRVKSNAADAVRDLRAEAALLEELGTSKPHQHIIRLIGTGTDGEGLPFIVLERLVNTLADELPKPGVRALDDLPTEPDEVSWCEWAVVASRWPLLRGLHVAYQLALALRHLHEGEALPRTRVLHRDIKPDNVGFLSDGCLVLFDFGLATRWEVSSKGEGAAGEVAEEARALTGQTGSTRYMAPEVALCQPYCGRAEVFSFGTILWQMCAHERPFRGFSVADFERRVARGGERPAIPRKWPPALRELVRDCWRPEPTERPGFGQVVSRLEGLLRAQLHARTASRARVERSPKEVLVEVVGEMAPVVTD